MLATWGTSTGFNPASLFSGGVQGAWYDPSDNTTMFQDAAGTTPVTAVEQAVGLILDKSKGLVLGPELVTNGDFSNGLTGWTQISGTFTASGGRAIAANTDSIKRLSNTASSMVAGRWYKITWNQYAGTGTGPINWTIPGVWSGADNFANSGNYINGEGEKTIYFYAPVSGQFYFYNFEQAVEYDNISVRELPGNHAYQTTSASRPTLRARYNLLTYSEEFNNAAWLKNGVTVTANSSIAPDGTVTADLVVVNNGSQTNVQTYQDLTSLVASTSYTISAYVKKSGARYAVVGWIYSAGVFGAVSYDLDTQLVSRNAVSGGFTITGTTITDVGSGWYRITVTATTPSTAAFSRFPGVFPRVTAWTSGAPDGSDVGDGVSGIFIWGAQLTNPAVFPSNTYQRIAASTDYATGAAFPQYLAFDGTDDSLLTASVDFTGTDKMTVWGGLTKLSDAAQGAVVELSATIASNNGTFLLAAPDGATQTFGWDSKGTTQVDAVASSVAAPRTSVVTGTADIGGDSCVIRVNGAVADTETGDQGTGNFGNYALFIGRRNNATIPFNGRIYSLIVRGAQSNSTQIAQTERYVASKTPLGVVP